MSKVESNYFNPTESRRELFRKAPERIVGVLALMSLPGLLEACGNSDITPELKSEGSKAVDIYKSVSDAGYEGTKGISMAQYLLEGGYLEDVDTYFKRIKENVSTTDEVVSSLAYVGAKHKTGTKYIIDNFKSSRTHTDADAIASDYVATVYTADYTPYEISSIYDQVTEFDGLKNFGFVASEDAVSVLTSIACKIGITATGQIYDDVRKVYKKDSKLARATLSLASYISDSTDKTMKSMDAINSFNFGFSASLQEENKALLALAANVSTYSISDVLSLYQYLGGATSLKEANISRLVLAISNVKGKFNLVSRVFKPGSEEIACAVLA